MPLRAHLPGAEDGAALNVQVVIGVADRLAIMRGRLDRQASRTAVCSAVKALPATRPRTVVC